MIPFTCPHCGLFTEVEDQYSGLTGACYNCGKTISVPAILQNAISSTASAGRPSGADWQGSATGGAATAGAAANLSPTGERLGKDARRGPSAAVLATVGAAVLLVVGCLVMSGIYFLTPLASIGRGLVARGQCNENLARIGQALRNYETEYGVFPPAYLADDKGKPMHSWRVLILPYLGQQTLYDQYSFAEPWDGPNNISLVGAMPEVFACPGDVDAFFVGETSYLVVQGPNTMFPGAVSRRPSDATDGQSTTILVVESHASAVSWTEPSDLEAQKLAFDVNSGADGEIGGNHENGAQALMVDGTVRLVRRSTPPEVVEAMLSPQGNDAVADEYLGN